MKVIASGRQTGKTTKLVEESAETGAVIVTIDSWTRKYVESLAKSLSLKIPMPITYNEFLSGSAFHSGRTIPAVLIDDFEQLLARFTSTPINTITTSVEK